MALSTKLYDPQSVIVVFGDHRIEGFAENSMVTVERNEDTFALKVGVDGEGTRVRSANRSGRVKVVLMQTSESNRVLSGIQVADEKSPIGAGIRPLMTKDAMGHSMHFAKEAWIVKPTAAEYGKEVGEREWEFESADMENFEGGN
jgi:hypothetical protein